jgi:hypothetical protein
MAVQRLSKPASTRIIREYVGARRDICGGYHRGSEGEPWAVTLWTENAAEHAAKLSELTGRKIDGRQVAWTEDHLNAVAERISDDMLTLHAQGIRVCAVGTVVMDNRVEVLVTDLTEPQIKALRDRYGDCLHIEEGEILAL